MTQAGADRSVSAGAQVDSVLEQIPALYGQNQVVGACVGGAVDACIQLLKLGTGGKLHVFASCLPKVVALMSLQQALVLIAQRLVT